ASEQARRDRRCRRDRLSLRLRAGTARRARRPPAGRRPGVVRVRARAPRVQAGARRQRSREDADQRARGASYERHELRAGRGAARADVDVGWRGRSRRQPDPALGRGDRRRPLRHDRRRLRPVQPLGRNDDTRRNAAAPVLHEPLVLPPVGLLRRSSQYAMAYQQYLNRFGRSEDEIAAVAVTFREHAMLNENAIMREPLTVEEYLNSRYICRPLRVYDCSLVNDGG